MRSGAKAVMSGMTVVVIGASLQASRTGGLAAVSPAAAGIVEPSTAPPSAAPPSPSALVAAAAPPPRVARRVAAARTPPSPAAVRTAAAPPPPPARRAVAASRAPRPAASSAPPRPSTVTVNGSQADTPYGPVQVQITLRGGRIVRADAIEYPQGGSRDQQINSYAIPRLDDETVQANSAQIDTVSGATYTSDGYRTSLQSALDAAHRAGAR